MAAPAQKTLKDFMVVRRRTLLAAAPQKAQAKLQAAKSLPPTDSTDDRPALPTRPRLLFLRPGPGDSPAAKGSPSTSSTRSSRTTDASSPLALKLTEAVGAIDPAMIPERPPLRRSLRARFVHLLPPPICTTVAPLEPQTSLSSSSSRETQPQTQSQLQLEEPNQKATKIAQEKETDEQCLIVAADADSGSKGRAAGDSNNGKQQDNLYSLPHLEDLARTSPAALVSAATPRESRPLTYSHRIPHGLRIRLPSTFEAIDQIFDALESTVMYQSGRGEASIFHRLQKTVQLVSNRTFTLDNLKTIVAVFPEAYSLLPVRIPHCGVRVDSYSLEFNVLWSRKRQLNDEELDLLASTNCNADRISSATDAVHTISSSSLPLLPYTCSSTSSSVPSLSPCSGLPREEDPQSSETKIAILSSPNKSRKVSDVSLQSPRRSSLFPLLSATGSPSSLSSSSSSYLFGQRGQVVGGSPSRTTDSAIVGTPPARVFKPEFAALDLPLRRAEFRQRLISIVDSAHARFCTDHGVEGWRPPLWNQNANQQRWRTDFDAESLAVLPVGAKLPRHRPLFSGTNLLRRPSAGTVRQSEVAAAAAAAAKTPSASPVSAATNGAAERYNSLLERIRQKEQRRKEQDATALSPDQMRRHTMLGRLYTIVCSVKTIIAAQEKATVQLSRLAQGVADGYPHPLSENGAAEHIVLLAEVVPRFCSVIDIGATKYIRVRECPLALVNEAIDNARSGVQAKPAA